jgi:hypothetical protein
MKPIMAQLMTDVKHDDETTRQPNRQSGNINERIAFVLEKISNRNSKVVFEHNGRLSLEGSVDFLVHTCIADKKVRAPFAVHFAHHQPPVIKSFSLGK